MKRRIVLLLLCVWQLVSLTHAQIQDVIVETYYIADEHDAADGYSSGLQVGATTYRVFIRLSDDATLLSIYGDENNPLKFNSTEPFFNHDEDGVTFGHEMNKNRLDEGTVPLDTWLAMGQTSKVFAQQAYVGVPKSLDTDGSIIGGENNDGGSEEIPGGLLINSTATMAPPLTVADGLTLAMELPTSISSAGIVDPVLGDETIFGENKSTFEGLNVELRSAGTTGYTNEHWVLIGQFTTAGEFSFSLNAEVEFVENGETVIKKFISNLENATGDEVFYSKFNYPFICGCKDPDYLEADPAFACEDQSKCLTRIVYGCMDPDACNYDPEANFNVQEICCYVGYCNDRDIELVCPELEDRE